MNRTLAILLTLIFLAPALASAEGPSITATTKISSDNQPNGMLVECFTNQNGEGCSDNNDGDVQLNWWAWSDETGSQWPDDDAKARSGEIGVSLTVDSAKIVYNADEDENSARSKMNTVQEQQPVINLEGEIQLIEENDNFLVLMPIEITPNYNLSNSTIMYIFLSQEYAQDNHGREINNLIFEMKPEIGFSNKLGNTTTTQWYLSSEHLDAAGVDMVNQPYGWHVTFALFGGIENSNSSHLLYLNQIKLNTQEDEFGFSDFIIPLIGIALAIVVIVSVIANLHKEEKGMPVMSAQWSTEKPDTLILTVITKEFKAEIKSCEVDEPWKLTNRFKSRMIEPNTMKKIELKFKTMEFEPCRLQVRIDVAELGSWTQFLVLSSTD